MTVATAPTFGQRLKALREAAGLTQQDLAERARLTKSGVSRIETGNRSPNWDTVVSLARALGVPVGAFDVEPPEGVADQGDEPEDEPPPAPKRRPKK